MMMFLSIFIIIALIPKAWILISPLIIIIMLILIQKSPFYLYSQTLENNFIFLDTLAWSMVLLSLVITFFSALATSEYLNPNNFSSKMMLFLLQVLLTTFLVKNFIHFYFLFELSLIPIFLIILGNGYQPERLFAAKSMFMYTVFSSLPLLGIMIMYLLNTQSTEFMFLSHMMLSETTIIINMMFFFLIFSFLVKFPMFSLHLWLPKAHVEAPVSGSMILAGILLKLGGFGLIRFSLMLTPMTPMLLFFNTSALMGGGLIAILCNQIMDMKVLIAYSSVAHMSLAISGILTASKISLLGSILMLISHGFTSSAMFMGANMMYLNTKSRNMIISKGLWSNNCFMTLWWALVCISNMAGPPSFNLLTEIVLILSLLATNVFNFIALTCLTFASVVFNLILFSLSQHSKLSKKSTNIKNSKNIENSIFFLHIILCYFPTILFFSIL